MIEKKPMWLDKEALDCNQLKQELKQRRGSSLKSTTLASSLVDVLRYLFDHTKELQSKQESTKYGKFASFMQPYLSEEAYRYLQIKYLESMENIQREEFEPVVGDLMASNGSKYDLSKIHQLILHHVRRTSDQKSLVEQHRAYKAWLKGVVEMIGEQKRGEVYLERGEFECEEFIEKQSLRTDESIHRLLYLLSASFEQDHKDTRTIFRQLDALSRVYRFLVLGRPFKKKPKHSVTESCRRFLIENMVREYHMLFFLIENDAFEVLWGQDTWLGECNTENVYFDVTTYNILILELSAIFYSEADVDFALYLLQKGIDILNKIIQLKSISHVDADIDLVADMYGLIHFYYERMIEYQPKHPGVDKWKKYASEANSLGRDLLDKQAAKYSNEDTDAFGSNSEE